MLTREDDHDFVIGSDEVGYGSWAGPLVVCAVMVPKKWVYPKGLTDSKALKHKERVRIQDEFFKESWPYTITITNASEIDAKGVYKCLLASHTLVISTLEERVLEWGKTALAVADGNLRLRHPILSVPKADALYPAVSMASVLAKVHRDKLMEVLHKKYPVYNWDKNKGYGTANHSEALERHGICPEHRTSFDPIRQILTEYPALKDLEDLLDGLPQE